MRGIEEFEIVTSYDTDTRGRIEEYVLSVVDEYGEIFVSELKPYEKSHIEKVKFIGESNRNVKEIFSKALLNNMKDSKIDVESFVKEMNRELGLPF